MTDPVPLPAPARRRPWADTLGMAAGVAALAGLFGLLSDHFFTLSTFTTIANQNTDLIIVAVGMTFVLIIAGIDLSVGSVLALSGATAGIAMTQWGWPAWAAAAPALGVGLLCGFGNGFISERWRIPSFIVTLGMLEVARGAAYLATNESTAYIGSRIEGVSAPLPIVGLSPAFFIAVAIVAAGQITLTRTVFGRYLIAIGTNEEAVRLSGINPRPIKIAVFCLLGMLTGLAGLFHAARLAAADPNAGIGFELLAIAAVVIGGTSLLGGRGSVLASFFGVLIIAILQTGLAQIGATEPTKRVITGLVIIAAVVADVYRRQWGRPRQIPGP